MGIVNGGGPDSTEDEEAAWESFAKGNEHSSKMMSLDTYILPDGSKHL